MRVKNRRLCHPQIMPMFIKTNPQLSLQRHYSILMLCVLCQLAVTAVAEAANKTDAEITQALIGTWEALPSEEAFPKTFLTFNANGTSRVIGIMASGDGSSRRSEGEARWRVKHGYLIAEPMLAFSHGVRMRFDLRVQIESIDDGVVRLRDEKGEKGELRRISHLPSLPPLVSPRVLTQEQALKLATYKPQPEYPIQARSQRMMGDGLFILRIQIRTGIVKGVQIEKSTGWSILDSSALTVLKQWRFKPGALSAQEKNSFAAEDYFLKVPVHFVLRH
jgi:TonB family protein